MISAESYFSDALKVTDPDVFQAIASELQRQSDQIELIASENLVSLASLHALGSVMVNKTVEGYPGRRYYGGAEFADVLETLAIERACALFDCKKRQRATAFGLTGQSGGVCRTPETG